LESAICGVSRKLARGLLYQGRRGGPEAALKGDHVTPKTDEFDTPWKDVSDLLFPQMMALLFPRAYRDIDWSRGWECFDKDFTKLFRDAEAKDRWADKLVRGRELRSPGR
jgi:hypothetical protein